MKTEISRNSHDPDKRYSGVYQQQGRMFTDSDVNEQVDIDKHRLNQALGDVIVNGTPREGGLGIMPGGRIRSGRIYIDGVPAEVPGNGSILAYDAQTDFPSSPVLPSAPHTLYADVWERTVDAMQDTRLLDVALHGADTCTRTQTMCQIKWCPEGSDPEDEVQNPTLGNALLTLKMRSLTTGADRCDPCAEIVDVATRTGNDVFRVEVHAVEYVGGLPANGIASFTLKWSGGNAAEYYAVGSEPEAFRRRRGVCEFFTLSSEKHAGVHLGTDAGCPRRGELSDTYPASPPAGFTHVRGWDGYCRIDALGGTLTGGVEFSTALSTSNASGSIGHVDIGTTLSIALTTMKLTLEVDSHTLVVGDYWLGEMREDAADIDAGLPDQQPPQGIVHHYLSLAEVDANGAVTLVYNGDCKRHGFPPLNDIRATDVCYDNSTCNFPDAKTVQDALDNLCRQKGLKYHNKHLHGWGIVCGLQLECAPYGSPDEREHIIVQRGSAIDCEGGDIILGHSRRYPVIERAMEIPEIAEIIKQNGDAVLSMGLREDTGGEPEFFLEPYDPKAATWQERLSGTLLMDFFEDCIKEPLEAIRVMFKPDAQSTELVSEADARLITLMNLLIQWEDYEHGRYVFLSQREDEILRGLYVFFRELLDSETYCAMFDDQPEFPPYPFPDTPRTTIFGPISKWREHDRLRIHPDGAWGCTMGGGDSHIQIYDLRNEIMVDEITHPGGEACAVQDVAFSLEGDIIYASALLDNKTVLAIGKLDGYRVQWADSKIICDLKLVSLGTSRIEPFSVYGVAEGKGLYLFDPAASPAVPQLLEECIATGHLVIPDADGLSDAFVTVGNVPGIYDEIRVIPLKRPADGSTPISRSITGFGAGEDDIAVVVDGDKSAHLYVVTGLSNPAAYGTSIANKGLVHFIGDQGEQQLQSVVLEDTQIRLASLHSQAQLLVTFADSFRMARLNVQSDVWQDEHIPMQMLTGCMAVDANGERVYVLNEASHTLNPIQGKEEKPIAKEMLAEYREGVLSAFSVLTTHLAQYLKDCFCHHLLIHCPECSEDDKIYLGSITIRGGEVYKVCNFSRRKYVKSFPTIGYWMSMLPFGHLLDWAVEALCCWVIPDPKKEYGLGVKKGSSLFYSDQPARKLNGIARTVQKADIGGGVNKQWQRMRIGGGLVGEGMGGGLLKLFVDQPLSMNKTGMIGQPVNLARGQLEKGGMTVVDIRDYTPDTGLKHAIDFASTPEYLASGDKVVLYQQNGKVKYYAVQPQSPVSVDVTPEMQARVAAMGQNIANIKAQSASLDGSIAEQRSQLDAAAGQQVALSRTLADVHATDFAAMQADVDTLQGNINVLQTKKSDLDTQIADLQAADFSGVQTTIEQLQGKKQALTKDVAALQGKSDTLAGTLVEQASAAKAMQTDIDKLSAARVNLQLQIGKDRIAYAPVDNVTGVTANNALGLKENGIRTISDLAQANPADLTTKLNIPAARAKKLVASAQLQLKG